MKITAIVIAKNEENRISDCLAALSLADEKLVIDTGSTDDTVKFAIAQGARVISRTGGGFAEWRNVGLKEASGDWVLYVDADELVGTKLWGEIKSLLASTQKSAFFIPRRNFILGQEMKHGGWYPDYVKRLFKKSALKEWTGGLHEEPVFTGDFGYTKEALIHNKHDNIADMITKTNTWSQIEAQLLYESNHPKMAGWRLVRMIITESWDRLIIKLGILDGYKGIIYGLYQAWSRMVTYTKLWELQLTK